MAISPDFRTTSPFNQPQQAAPQVAQLPTPSATVAQPQALPVTPTPVTAATGVRPTIQLGGTTVPDPLQPLPTPPALGQLRDFLARINPDTQFRAQQRVINAQAAAGRETAGRQITRNRLGAGAGLQFLRDQGARTQALLAQARGNVTQQTQQTQLQGIAALLNAEFGLRGQDLSQSQLLLSQVLQGT